MNDITVFTEKPCEDALDWLETQTSLDAAWENCPRGDWMWWALRHLPEKMPNKAQSVQYARWCAERARDAAYAAAFAADAAYAARVTAADAAEAAAAEAAAAAAAYAAAASASDYDAEIQAQAEWIREHISNPFEGE